MKQNMKKIIYLFTIIILLSSCKELEDEFWDNNVMIHADWKDANLETGKRPYEQNTYTIYSYPQIRDEFGSAHPFAKDNTPINLETDVYDFIIYNDMKFVNRQPMFKTAEISLPTIISEKNEQIITDFPDSMVYVGISENNVVKFEKQSEVDIKMIRMFKRVNFNITLGDKEELTEPLQVELSGVANRKRVWDQQLLNTDESIMMFSLNRRGRYVNTTHYLTTYAGHVLILGITGRNILTMYYTDADDEIKRLDVDLTENLKNWNTEEVTVKMLVNVYDETQPDVVVNEWEKGDTSDVPATYNLE